ncbi:MAG: hypothetical protein K0R00_68 [Herbinix sp.]|jgi:hypothetical protein|nr:hypothetical protein [Herbinix sp.]
MALSLWNFIVIDGDGNSSVYVATTISNAIDSIADAFEPTAILRTTLYSNNCNDYDNVVTVNYSGT